MSDYIKTDFFVNAKILLSNVSNYYLNFYVYQTVLLKVLDLQFVASNAEIVFWIIKLFKNKSILKKALTVG